MNLNIVLAPKDINFVPSADAVREVAEFLEEEIQDYVEFIEASIAPRLFYIDEGDSFMSAIGCPVCQSRLSTQGPHSEWIRALREELMAKQQLDLGSHQVRMPCCNKDAPVVALDFGGQAGFARFSIALEGADIDDQEETLMDKAGKILGCELVRIELAST